MTASGASDRFPQPFRWLESAMSRVVKKRRKKIRKHKHRKMLARTRHQRRKKK